MTMEREERVLKKENSNMRPANDNDLVPEIISRLTLGGARERKAGRYEVKEVFCRLV